MIASHPIPTIWPRDEERFWSYVAVGSNENDCWLWTGRTWSGYGVFEVSIDHTHTHNLKAHRLAYFLTSGIDPAKNVVMHQCDVKSCVHWRHLKLGDTQQNLADYHNKARMYREFYRRMNSAA